MKKLIITLSILSGLFFFSGNAFAAKAPDIDTAIDILLKAGIMQKSDMDYYKENTATKEKGFVDRDKVLGLIVDAVKKLSGKSSMSVEEAVSYLGEKKIVNAKYWEPVVKKGKQVSKHSTRMLLIRLAEAVEAQ